MPSNHKRQASARTAGGPATPDQPAAPPAETPATETTTAAIAPAPPPPAPSQPPPPSQPQQASPAQQASSRRDGLRITDLKDMSIQKLTQIAKDLSVGGATGMRK